MARDLTVYTALVCVGSMRGGSTVAGPGVRGETLRRVGGRGGMEKKSLDGVGLWCYNRNSERTRPRRWGAGAGWICF